MWVEGLRTGLIAQVFNPKDVPQPFTWSTWNDESVYIYKGFKFPDALKDKPGTDCFAKVKRKKFWKGLKVKWDVNQQTFNTL